MNHVKLSIVDTGQQERAKPQQIILHSNFNHFLKLNLSHFRLYINANTLFNEWGGFRGPTPPQFVQRKTIDHQYELFDAKRNATIFLARQDLLNRRKRTKVLKYQIRIMLDVFCRHYAQERLEQRRKRLEQRRELLEQNATEPIE